MLSVGVCVNSWHYFANPFKLQPINELMLATFLRSTLSVKDAQIVVHDLRQVRRADAGFTPELLALQIPEHDVFLFWIAKTADYPEAASVTKILKIQYPNALVVAGGTHPELFPEKTLLDFDCVVTGPGEGGIPILLGDLVNGRPVKRIYGSSWKDHPYSALPHPDRSLLPESAVINLELFAQYGGERATSAMFSRGCNFACSYCAYRNPPFIQRRTPEQILSEIEYLKADYGLGAINLRDEICIPLSRTHSDLFLEVMTKAGVMWRGQTRVGPGLDVLMQARKSGCVELAVGVESASQRTLDIINKKQRLEDAEAFIRNCREVGIRVKMCLILGLPGEPEDIVERTINLIERAKPDFVNVSGFCPIPGSEVFNHPERFGIASIDHKWDRHAHLMCRFSSDEKFGLPFNYAPTAPWGQTFSRSQIWDNIQTLQQYLRERSMVY